MLYGSHPEPGFHNPVYLQDSDQSLCIKKCRKAFRCTVSERDTNIFIEELAAEDFKIAPGYDLKTAIRPTRVQDNNIGVLQNL